MSLADSQLAGNVIAILRSDPAMRKVNFRYGKFTIGSMHYLTVAGLIDAGRIHCVVDSTKIPAGAAAAYEATHNTIYGKDAQFQYNDERASMVHEATHAYLDVLGAVKKGFTVKNLDNETCAFLAGAIYTQALGTQTSPGVKVTIFGGTHDIHLAALAAVQKKGLGTGFTNAGSPILFETKDVSDLQAAIKNHKLYKDWNASHVMDGV